MIRFETLSNPCFANDAISTTSHHTHCMKCGRPFEDSKIEYFKCFYINRNKFYDFCTDCYDNTNTLELLYIGFKYHKARAKRLKPFVIRIGKCLSDNNKR